MQQSVARGETTGARPLRSRRRRAGGRLLGLKSRSGARLIARRGSATSKQPSRCRSAAERQCRRWNHETAGPAQRQQCEPTGRALLIRPFSTVSRETLVSVAERNCYAGGSVSHGLIGSPPYRYRRPALLIATTGGPVLQRHTASSSTCVRFSGNHGPFPHRSIPRSAMAAEVNTKACEAGVEGLRTAP
jgi:hypothetical protein